MTLLTVGTWKARGVDAVLGFTAGHKEQIGVELELLDGPDTGSRITWYGYFTDQTIERTFESLRLLGWLGDDLANLGGIGDTVVHAVIIQEPDLQGVLRSRVNFINDPDRGGVAIRDRMAVGDAMAFAARMKGAAMAARKKAAEQASTGRAPARTPAPQPTAAAPAPAQPNAADDNIPFAFNESVDELPGVGERWTIKLTSRPIV